MQDSLCHGPFHCRVKTDTSATRSSGHIWAFSTAGAMETLQNDQRIWPNVWLRSIFTEEGETGWRTCGKRSCSQRMHLACSIYINQHYAGSGGRALRCYIHPPGGRLRSLSFRFLKSLPRPLRIKGADLQDLIYQFVRCLSCVNPVPFTL